MKQFFQWMNQDENIRSAGDAFLKPGCHSIYGLSGSVKSALVAKVLHEGPRQVVLVVPSREQAAAWQADLAFLVPNVKILDFPVVDKAVFTTTAKSLDRMARQMEALGRLRQGDPVLVLAAPEEAAQYVMAPQRIDDAAIDVEIQGEYDRDDLLQHLVNAGYERVDMVERRGHFSVRGDIVDVFAVNEPQPLRLAFFGDELESIRSFDVDTQKSLNDADRARILPVSLTTADDENIPSSIMSKRGPSSGMNPIGSAKALKDPQRIGRLQGRPGVVEKYGLAGTSRAAGRLVAHGPVRARYVHRPVLQLCR